MQPCTHTFSTWVPHTSLKVKVSVKGRGQCLLKYFGTWHFFLRIYLFIFYIWYTIDYWEKWRISISAEMMQHRDLFLTAKQKKKNNNRPLGVFKDGNIIGMLIKKECRHSVHSFRLPHDDVVKGVPFFIRLCLCFVNFMFRGVNRASWLAVGSGTSL